MGMALCLIRDKPEVPTSTFGSDTFNIEIPTSAPTDSRLLPDFRRFNMALSASPTSMGCRREGLGVTPEVEILLRSSSTLIFSLPVLDSTADFSSGTLHNRVDNRSLLLMAASDELSGVPNVGEGVKRLESKGDDDDGKGDGASSNSRSSTFSSAFPEKAAGTGSVGSPIKLPCLRSSGLGRRDNVTSGCSSSCTDNFRVLPDATNCSTVTKAVGLTTGPAVAVLSVIVGGQVTCDRYLGVG